MVSDTFFDEVTKMLPKLPDVLGDRWPQFHARLSALLTPLPRDTGSAIDERVRNDVDELFGQYPEFTGLREKHRAPDQQPKRWIKSNQAAAEPRRDLPGTHNHMIDQLRRGVEAMDPTARKSVRSGDKPVESSPSQQPARKTLVE